jgi:hypothetical protein
VPVPHPDHHLNRSALLVTGTVSIGKTTVAEHIGNRLTEIGVPHAVINLDRLRHAWPAPEGDRFNMALALGNLASVTANSLEAGTQDRDSRRCRKRRGARPIPEGPAHCPVGMPFSEHRFRSYTSGCTGVTPTTRKDCGGIWHAPVSSTGSSPPPG